MINFNDKTPPCKNKFRTNFIVIKEDDEFKWVVCDFISNDINGDNTTDIDKKILALRDNDGAISKKQLDLLIEEYWASLPPKIKEHHDINDVIRITSDDEDAFTALCDFTGGEAKAINLLSNHGFYIEIEPGPNRLQQDCDI